jgi:hypothetical protein
MVAAARVQADLDNVQPETGMWGVRAMEQGSIEIKCPLCASFVLVF